MIDNNGNRSEEVTISIKSKLQSSNAKLNPNVKTQISKLFSNLTFSHLNFIWPLDFDINSMASKS